MATITIKRRVGIMGGTFNPIHNGHLLLAETARDRCILDQVLFLPSGNSYMKEESEIAPSEARVHMTMLAIEDNPYFALSRIEVDRPGNTYTYETLEELHKQQPDWELFFILGADCLFMMEDWKYPERIFRDCHILAAVRDDKDRTDLVNQINHLRERFKAQITLLPMKEIGISSTDIRERIRSGHSVQYLLPSKVIAYMTQHHIYLETEGEKKGTGRKN